MTYMPYDEVEYTEAEYRELLEQLRALRVRLSELDRQEFQLKAETAQLNAELYRLGVRNGVHGLDNVIRDMLRDLRDLDETVGVPTAPVFDEIEDDEELIITDDMFEPFEEQPDHVVQSFDGDELLADGDASERVEQVLAHSQELLGDARIEMTIEAESTPLRHPVVALADDADQGA